MINLILYSLTEDMLVYGVWCSIFYKMSRYRGHLKFVVTSLLARGPSISGAGKGQRREKVWYVRYHTAFRIAEW